MDRIGIFDGDAMAGGIGRLDVDAMRLLVAIHDRGSFTRAAELLGVNQSTASYTVAHLRRVLDDALFIRAGNRVEPTPRCAEVVAELRAILDRLDRLAAARPFDPATARGEVVVSSNLHERLVLLPQVLRRIRAAAPGLRVHLFDAGTGGRAQLMENRADILLGPVEIQGDIFYRRHLFTDRYVCVMDPAHPLARGVLDLAAYACADHLWITHNGRWQAPFVPRLAAEGLEVRPCVTTPSHDNLEGMIGGTALVATIPESLARHAAPGMALRPFPLDVRIGIDMYWTARTHGSGVHQWLRQLLAEAAEALR